MAVSTEKVLAAAFSDLGAAYYLREALDNDLTLPNPFHRQLARFLGEFLDENRALPKEGDIQLWMGSLPEKVQVGVREAYAKIRRQDLTGFTLDYLKLHAFEEMKKVATTAAVSRLAQMNSPTPDDIRELAEQVSSIRPLEIEGLANMADVERWIRPEADEEAVPTGITKLDQYIGGVRKELLFLMADTGVGKTIALINLGAAMAQRGETVLHITLELSTRNTLHRYYRRVAEGRRKEFHSSLKEVTGRVSHWLRFAKGSVHVLYLDAYSIDPHQLERIIARFSDMEQKPGVIILDYMDLLNPPPETNRRSTYEQLARMSHLVRNYCHTFDCRVLSAAQATRAAGTATRLRLDHMSDSYGKVRAADVVLGLVQTDEEADVHQGRLGLLKLRENPGTGLEIPLYINRDLMMISDLDHPNTQRVMKEEGHWPPATLEHGRRPGEDDDGGE